MAPNTVLKKYSLVVGENTFSSPAAVNENDARKLQSLIPSLSGALERERPALLFALTTLPGRVGFFHQFGRNNGSSIVYYWFCATSTALYQLAGTWPSTTWVKVQQVGTLADFPVAVNIDNAMQLDDAGNGRSWLFDGTNWVRTGLPIPLHAPKFTAQAAPANVSITSISRTNNIVVATVSGVTGYSVGLGITTAGVTDASFIGTFQLTAVNAVAATLTWQQFDQPDAGSSGGTVSAPGITIAANRFYWFTWVDATVGRRQHESSSSHISVGTGAQTAKTFKVQMRFGSVSSADGVSFLGSGTDFSQDDVGMVLYAGVSPQAVGVINTVTDATHLTVNPAMSPYTSAVISAGATFVIAPQRATHWNVYASASETDRVGNLLANLPVTSTFLIDDSPMIGDAKSLFSSIERPLLNDPPPASAVMEVHKTRVYRRVPTNLNFISFTGFEEVAAEQAGSPYESVPGADPNTQSPAQVNEDSFPDQSIHVRGLCSHGDSLYVGTERDILPWYGDSLQNFSFSPAYAFRVGFAGRRLCCSTPFGLAFVSYDFKVYLYPSQYSFGTDSTTALVELGRPKRPEFEQMSGADLMNGHLLFYNWGRRNWLVLTYQRRDGTYGSWIFDFEVKGWFQLQQGYTAVAVFEMSPGLKSLIGATPDGKTWVIDDLTGTFPVSAGTTYPVGYVRFLLDFGDPDAYFVIKSIGYEKSTRDMEVDVTVWKDPEDPENPGVGIPVFMSQTRLGANSFEGRPNSDTGATCQRLLVEFAVAASAVNGRFHGFTVESQKADINPSPIEATQ